MNVYLNYVLEASIGLCLFLVVYQLLLKKETNFGFNRMFMLTAIVASVTFPLINLNTANSPVPSLNFSIEPAAPASASPALSVAELENEPLQKSFSIWQLAGIVYAAGLLLFFVVFIIRLSAILKAFRQSHTYAYNQHRIVELKADHSPFSFFNFIFISKTALLSEKERQQIIEHESIHVKLYHSVDIVLLHVVGIIFWFNPLIKIYKKIFVQLHEFEADARAVEKHDVDEYCSLLARVALHSVDYKLANHFSNSLTLKRIEMMRTLKQKIKHWKFAAIAVVLPVFFFAVACQDQMMDEAVSLAQNSTMAIDYPQEVQDKLNKLQKEFPESKFVVIEPNEENGLVQAEEMKKSLAHIDPSSIKSVQLMKNIKDDDGRVRSFVIVNYDERTKAVFEKAVGADGIFTAVEQAASPKGGMDQLKAFLKENLSYTEPSKPGKVFISLVINIDGSLTDFTIIKGMSAELDQEALRVAKLMENWNPAQQNGKPVRSRFIFPIPFGPPQSGSSNEVIEVREQIRD